MGVCVRAWVRSCVGARAHMSYGGVDRTRVECLPVPKLGSRGLLEGAPEESVRAVIFLCEEEQGAGIDELV